MKKVLSFSLFGSNPIYIKGLESNFELSRIHYPDWQIRVYAESEVFPKMEKYYQDCNLEIIEFKSRFPNQGLFERFKPIFDGEVDVWISRDLDSRITTRESAAVNEWLESGLNLHIMRDCHNHSYPIMAGMFGMKRINSLSRLRIKRIISQYYSSDMTSDQKFLAEVIWDKFKNHSLIHDHWNNRAVVNIPKDANPPDGVLVNEAYGVGIVKFLSSERKSRHAEIFPDGAVIRNFPKESDSNEPLYVGQVVLPNNSPAFSQDMRWEYELRGKSIPTSFGTN